MKKTSEYLVLSDGKQEKIPTHTQQNDKNKFVVELQNPLSIASILKYQIENWDEQQIKKLTKAGYNSVAYGYLDEDGDFESYSGNDEYINDEWKKEYFSTFDDYFYDELVFAKSAVAYPELLPLLEEYAKLLVEASKNERTSGPWATEETVLGQFLIFELADQDKKYVSLAEDFGQNVEVRCSDNTRREYLDSMKKLYQKLGIEAKVIDVAEAIDDSELDDDIDYDGFFEALQEDEDLSDEDRVCIDQFIELKSTFTEQYLLAENEILTYFATDGDNGPFIFTDKQKYISFRLNVEDKTFEMTTPDETIQVSLSDNLIELASDIFEEVL